MFGAVTLLETPRPPHEVCTVWVHAFSVNSFLQIK